MLIDGLVIFGLNIWEKRLKAEKERLEQEAANAADTKHEADKKADRAKKAAQREQRKVEEKKIQNIKGQTAFNMKNPIQQPDKNKKQH